MLQKKPVPAPPITASEFDQLISLFGLLEAEPLVAVGVSGGADSLCLVLLMDSWLRRRRGRAVALIVDHQLRPEAKQEIQQLVGWLANYGIEYHVLVWGNKKPGNKSQAAAREARYDLLTGWCNRTGVLHLALAHHRDDQAETHLLRKARGSGADGLAAMPIVWEQNNVRMLRPLLSVPGARLRATLRCMHQRWVEDPSNDDPTYSRTHVRRKLAKLSEENKGAAHIATVASDYARVRREADEATALLLVRVTQIAPAGFCWLDQTLLADAPTTVGLRALAQILLAIGGNKYGARRESLLLLYEVLRKNRLVGGRTIGGCCITPSRNRTLICREPAAADHVLSLLPGQWSLWDHRFHVALDRWCAGGRRQFKVHRLGVNGWCVVKRKQSSVNERTLPLFVRYCLPALWDLDGLVAVPHLDYLRDDSFGGDQQLFTANFRPRRAFAGPPFQGVNSLVPVTGNTK